MKLHQLLRVISNTTAILLFDIQGIQICKVRNKQDINVDLYEYDVLECTTGPYDTVMKNKSALYIVLQK